MNGNFEDSTRSEKFSEKFMSQTCLQKTTVAMILWCVVAVTVVGGGWLLFVVVGCCLLLVVLVGWLLIVVAGYPLTQGAPEKPPHDYRSPRFYPMGQECEKVNVPRSQGRSLQKKGGDLGIFVAGRFVQGSLDSEGSLVTAMEVDRWRGWTWGSNWV